MMRRYIKSFIGGFTFGFLCLTLGLTIIYTCHCTVLIFIPHYVSEEYIYLINTTIMFSIVLTSILISVINMLNPYTEYQEFDDYSNIEPNSFYLNIDFFFLTTS
ncbi:hypothetical protein QTN25_009540 [Entamoeba marina]